MSPGPSQRGTPELSYYCPSLSEPPIEPPVEDFNNIHYPPSHGFDVASLSSPMYAFDALRGQAGDGLGHYTAGGEFLPEPRHSPLHPGWLSMALPQGNWVGRPLPSSPYERFDHVATNTRGLPTTPTFSPYGHCPGRFPNPDHRRNHEASMHINNSSREAVCTHPSCSGRSFSSQRELNRHVATIHSTPDQPGYRCHCGKENHRKDNYLRHVRSLTACPGTVKHNFVCYCGKEDRNRNAHIVHVLKCGLKPRGRKAKL